MFLHMIYLPMSLFTQIIQHVYYVYTCLYISHHMCIQTHICVHTHNVFYTYPRRAWRPWVVKKQKKYTNKCVFFYTYPRRARRPWVVCGSNSRCACDPCSRCSCIRFTSHMLYLIILNLGSNITYSICKVSICNVKAYVM